MELITPVNENQRRVLKVCNRIREEFGKDPLDGIPKGVGNYSSTDCPVCKMIDEDIAVGPKDITAFDLSSAKKISRGLRKKIRCNSTGTLYYIDFPLFVQEFISNVDCLSRNYAILLEEETITTGE